VPAKATTSSPDPAAVTASLILHGLPWEQAPPLPPGDA
jgi:hypothetical protein